VTQSDQCIIVNTRLFDFQSSNWQYFLAIVAMCLNYHCLAFVGLRMQFGRCLPTNDDVAGFRKWFLYDAYCAFHSYTTGWPKKV